MCTISLDQISLSIAMYRAMYDNVCDVRTIHSHNNILSSKFCDEVLFQIMVLP